MGVFKSLTRSNFFIKLRSWEYWPFGVVQLPLFIYYFYLSIRARSFVFFSASNPGIEMGGMLGESKYDVIKIMPQAIVPKTALIKIPASTDQVMTIIEKLGFSLPVIFKPDLGERGFMVKKISNEEDVAAYLSKIRVNFLIQDLVDLPMEFGIFYTRFPSDEKGRVTSVVMKEMLFVTGDGTSTLQQLILKKDRAKLQWENLKHSFSSRLDEVIRKGENIELVSIGNHALGTKFMNGNHLINDKLSETFDGISKQIDGFFFGRYDIRCATLEDLYNGRIKVLELNGCGAEPAHIYDPDFSLLKGISVMLTHWNNMYRISVENHERGVKYTSFKEAKMFYRKFKEATRR